MKFIVLNEGQSFVDIDSIGDMLGISRRSVFEYLRQIHINPEDKKKVGSKLYFSDEVIGRIWARRRRIERGGDRKERRAGVIKKEFAKTKPNNPGPMGVPLGTPAKEVEVPKPQPVQTQENRQAMNAAIDRILAKL